MAIYTKEEQLELINKDWENLKLIDNQYEDVCLEAIRKCVGAFEYVKEQTPRICLETVKKDFCGIKLIKEQTHELCLEAVKADGNSLRYIKEQTKEICLEAVKKNGWIIFYVRDKTPDVCFCAFVNVSDIFNESEYVRDKIKEYMENNNIKNKVFCGKNIKEFGKADFYFNNYSLEYLKHYLLKENSDNKYIFFDNDDINILKEIAISNNELIVVDTGNLEDIHRALANKIITLEDLEKGAL